jgi:hypothetical protein
VGELLSADATISLLDRTAVFTSALREKTTFAFFAVCVAKPHFWK